MFDTESVRVCSRGTRAGTSIRVVWIKTHILLWGSCPQICVAGLSSQLLLEAVADLFSCWIQNKQLRKDGADLTKSASNAACNQLAGWDTWADSVDRAGQNPGVVFGVHESLHAKE